jgi:hypothetical protein
MIGKGYGTPSNPKLEWDFEIIGKTSGGTEEKLSEKYPDFYKTLINGSCFYTFRNGTVTANSEENFNKNLEKYKTGYGSGNYSSFGFSVSVKTTDGTKLSAEKGIIYPVKPAASTIFKTYSRSQYKTGETPSVKYSLIDSAIAELKIDLKSEETNKYAAYPPALKVDVKDPSGNAVSYLVSSDNPRIMGAYYDKDFKITLTDGGTVNVIKIRAYAAGTANVVITPADGSGQKYKLKVTIVEEQAEEELIEELIP